MSDQNEYILGTEKEELYRLGLQHQVWSSEASQAWFDAGFKEGMTLLDLGCGPGFCTTELGFIVGEKGKVIGVDKSQNFIKYIQNMNASLGLNLDLRCIDLADLELEANSLDGMYCRWVLAWMEGVDLICKKVYDALKPGGKIVIHEYFDWSTFQFSPEPPALRRALKGCLDSWNAMEGNLNIGKEIAPILSSLGMKIVSTRPLTKIAKPDNMVWQWPASFLRIYLPKLVKAGFINDQELKAALAALDEVQANNNAIILTPVLIEIIAEKI